LSLTGTDSFSVVKFGVISMWIYRQPQVGAESKAKSRGDVKAKAQKIAILFMNNARRCAIANNSLRIRNVEG